MPHSHRVRGASKRAQVSCHRCEWLGGANAGLYIQTLSGERERDLMVLAERRSVEERRLVDDGRSKFCAIYRSTNRFIYKYLAGIKEKAKHFEW